MKVLRILLIVLGVLFLLFVGVNAFSPKTYHVERSIEINAPASAAFAFVGNFKEWSKWSVWSMRDSTMVNTYSESPLPNQVDGWQAWTSEFSGNGKQTFTAMEVPTYLATRLEFEGMGESTTEFRFEENEEGVTTVTWTFDGEAGGFFGRWVTRFMDGWIGPDYETGLANLKALAEAAPTIPMEVMNSEAINYFGIRYASDLSDLLADEILEYRKVKAALAEDSANIAGNPFVYFEAFAGMTSVADYIVGVPYSGSLEKEGFVKGMLPSRKVLKVTHTGHPTQLDGVLDAVKAHMKKNNYSTNGNVWMEYVNSGPNIPLEEWVQHIYFPISETTELQ